MNDLTTQMQPDASPGNAPPTLDMVARLQDENRTLTAKLALAGAARDAARHQAQELEHRLVFATDAWHTAEHAACATEERAERAVRRYTWLAYGWAMVAGAMAVQWLYAVNPGMWQRHADLLNSLL